MLCQQNAKVHEPFVLMVFCNFFQNFEGVFDTATATLNLVDLLLLNNLFEDAMTACENFAKKRGKMSTIPNVFPAYLVACLSLVSLVKASG